MLAGSNAGPRPSLDTLDPSRRTSGKDESDANRAKRFIDRVARVDAPPVDAGPVHIELTPMDGGGFTYETGGFVAEIDAAGDVVFHDKGTSSSLSAHGDTPTSGPRNPYGKILTENDPPATDVSHEHHMSGPSALVTFDPTAALLRAQGQDPYASEKSCFLDDTRDLRADLKEKHDRLQLARLRRDLERAWFDAQTSPAERRAALFAMWDECREDGVGARARQLVESFVRQHLPKGSADAFSGEELVALNAHRSSTAEFKPYG